MASRDYDVVLYGASGYTGDLIAHELDALGANFAIAGRDGARLQAVAGRLPSKPSKFVVGVDDTAELRELFSSARVVLSAAGPFARLGPPLLEAALTAAAHWVDITGEQAFLRWAADQHGPALEAGVTVLSAAGFDVVPSDIAAVLASRELPDVERLDLAIAVKGGRLSRGTRRSMAESRGGWWYDRGVFRNGPVGRFARRFTFPDPVGERTAVFVPWGDVATAPRSTGAHTVRTFFAVPRRRARAMRLAWPVTGLVMKGGLVRGRLTARAVRGPVGPSPEERAATRWMVLAEATSSAGVVSRAWTSGRDPYGLTGAAAAHAAVELAGGRIRRRGVVTPGQVFTAEEMVKALSRFGFRSGGGGR